MKYHFFYAIIFLLLSYSITSQNSRFLEKKGFYEGNASESITIFPTVNSENSKLIVSRFTTESTATKMKMDYSGFLLNLTNGRVERDFKGLQAYFIYNDLFINDVKEVSGKWLGFMQVLKEFENTPYYLLDSETGEKHYLNFPKGEYLTDSRDNYIMTMKTMQESVTLLERTGKSLKRKGTYNMFMGFIAPSKTEVYGSSIDQKMIKIFDMNSGALNYSLKLNRNPVQVHLTRDNKLIYSVSSGTNAGKFTDLIIRDRYSNQIIKNISLGQGTIYFRCNDAGDEMVTVHSESGLVKLWSIPSGELLAEARGSYYDMTKGRKKSANVFNLDSNGKFYIITYSNGIMSLFSSEERKIIADIFTDEHDWAVIARDGRIDGTDSAFAKLEWHEYDQSGHLINSTSLTSTISNFYTPRLLYSILNEGLEEEGLIEEQIDNTPRLEILNIKDNQTVRDIEFEFKVKAVYKNDPYKEIAVYLNDKLVDAKLINSEKSGSELINTYTVELVTGYNVIKCIARSEKNFESEPQEAYVFFKGMKKTTDLYMLVIGINKYKNPRYELNYANADARAFKEIIESGSSKIFQEQSVIYLSDSEASKENITNAFTEIISKAEASDVFILYYAGHGVMSEEQKSEFYMIPYDVTQIYGDNDQLKTKGISAEELREFSKKIRAQKQLYVFDACQSGGLVDKIAKRGVAEERAIAQLARSTGTFWLTASNSEQYATEFGELGHGLFTYTLLKGIGGDADGGENDKKITVKEISAYLNDMVPQLSKKYKGMPQYPTSYGYGQDFPVKVND